MFLRQWIQCHYEEALELNRPDNSGFASEMRDLPEDFVPLAYEEVVERSWVGKWIAKLKLGEWWEWISDTVVKYGKLLSIAVAVIGTLVTANALYSYVVATPSGYSSGYSLASAPRGAAVSTRVQVVSGSHEYDNKIRLLYNNLAWIMAPEKPGASYIVRSLFIRDRWVLMTKHQYLHLLNAEQSGKQVTIVTVRDKVVRKMQLEGCPTLQLEGYDMVSVYLSPTTVSAYKSVIQFANTQEQLDRARRKAMIMTSEPNRDFAIHTKDVLVTNVSVGVKSYNPDIDQDVQYEGLIETIGYSGKNICGTLLLANDNNNPFFGFYFSSDKKVEDGYAYAMPVNQTVLKNLSPTEVTDILGLQPTPSEIENKQSVLAGDYYCVGEISRTRVPYQNSKTKIQFSMIHEDLCKNNVPNVTEPCCLSKTDKRWIHDKSPLISGCENLCQPKKDFPIKLENLVVKAAEICTLHYAQPILVDVSTRTVSQAVCGLSVDEYPPIKKDTSVGWPYNLLKNDKNQMIRRQDILNPVFDENGQMIDVNPVQWFKTDLAEKLDMRKNGIVVPTVFWDHLKDERRKKEKLRAIGGTRIFFSVSYRFLNSV